MVKLTKRIVDAAAPDPNGGRLYLFDDEVTGFGLAVQKSGLKTYFVTWGPKNRRKRMTIGRHGAPWTPDEAREKAREHLREVAAGIDPLEEKTKRRKAATVAELVELYLEEGPADKPNKRASSWATDASNLRRHVVPLLGKKALPMLASADIARFQRDVAAGKSAADIKTKVRGRAIVEGGKGIASRTLAVLGAMLQFALARGLITSNPARGVKPFKGEKKERFLSNRETELLADAVTILEELRMISKATAGAIRLLMLTGCRKGEVVGLRWSYVDFERGSLNLPFSKTGAKRVPIGAAALKLLSELTRASDFVFPGPGNEAPISGLQKSWEMVREWAGLPGLRLHDLRHSFASSAAADGESLYILGKVLGHSQVRTTEGYAHVQIDPMRALADRTSSKIEAAMKGGRGGAEIIDIVPLVKRG